MFRAIYLLYLVPATLSIIIRDPPPSPNDYKYSYNIEDPSTGDSKSQHEVRRGGVVTGAYSVLGPDGTKRTVEYTADDQHGFKATISEDVPAVNPFYQDYNSILNSVPVPLEGKDNYIDPKQVVYFTPENAQPPRAPFAGRYFIPAYLD